MTDKLTKIQGWERRFSALIEKYYFLPFERGENCCFLFISDIYEALSGQSHISKWRGKFKTKTKAMALYFANTGSTSFEDVFQWAEPVENHLMSQMGYIGMYVDEDGTEFLGVISPNGRQFLVRCEDKDGLLAVPITDKLRLWRVV